MKPARIGALAQRIVRQFRRDRRSLALLFIAPLVLFSLLWYVFRGTSPRPTIALVDQDHGIAGVALRSALDTTSGLQVVTRSDTASADRALKDGTLAAYIVVPAGASAQTPGAAPLPLTLVLEGSDPSQSGAVAAQISRALQKFALQMAPQLPLPRLTTAYLYGGPAFDTLDYLAPVMIGLFAFFLVYLLTSVSFLRERTQGTLERLMASPLQRGEIALGYMLGFLGFALIQALLILLFSIFILQVQFKGNLGLAFLIEALLAIGAVNLGIFLSTFARTELQVVQFVPLVIVPQVLLSGVFFAVESMPQPLQVIAHAMPLTYAQWGLRDVMIRGFGLDQPGLLFDLLILGLFAVLMILLASLTLRRQVA